MLVDYGFRLPSALDNRPLTFDEFRDRIHQVIAVSATPGPEELERTLERTLDRIAKRAGFARVSHRLDLLGLCADCAAEVGTDTLRG